MRAAATRCCSPPSTTDKSPIKVSRHEVRPSIHSYSMSGPGRDEHEEALGLLRESEMQRARPARSDAAAKALFESLHQLSGKHRFEVSVWGDWNELEASLSGLPPSSVTYMRETGVTVGTGSTNRIEVELDYDPTARQLVGRASDEYRVPMPGDIARQRRPALAVLVDAIIKTATAAETGAR